MTAPWRKPCPPGQAAREAAGLRWLAGAGGCRVVRVLGAEDDLLLERLSPRRADAPAAEALGVALARTHAAGAPWWGAPPPGTEGDGQLGAAALPTPSTPPAGWGAFYAGWRLQPYLRAARDAGTLDAAASQELDRLLSRIADGHHDHDQPALVRSSGHVAARLHGDLWSGNVVWTGDPVEAVLIDPAAHGGHAETDLAMLALFGLPHLEHVLAGYHEASPLADGWRERVALHQLHPLAVHVLLFGDSYVAPLLQAARRAAEGRGRDSGAVGPGW
ncbi:fructosamine kinase family protein [Auraticoccus monumenti]|uniref:Fructosamine-3-kinase n=1 Tax=Auraticoccus monumenti TaxID=675864 RepID=A0A1G7A648_9ACTN|nr:fructosamine kinase family protein [Auraticoccus monumenti]SDE10260.1 Fructosamine-3-kinase [Auraticoccus monumenti]